MDAPTFERTYEEDVDINGVEIKRDVSLHRAAERGSVDELTHFLDAGCDINGRDASECTALHRAIYADKPLVVRFLLSRGADAGLKGVPESDGTGGDDAVLCAARFLRMGVMKELIVAGVPNVLDGLGFAIRGGSMDMLRLLLETTSSEVTKKPQEQAIGSILHQAAYTWSLKMVKYLMEEMGYEKVAMDADKQRALDAALLDVFVQHGYLDIDNWVDPDGDRTQVLKIVEILVDAGASVNAQDEAMQLAPLHYALQLRPLHLELLDYLLDHGAEVNTPDHRGCTPVFELLRHPAATEELIGRFKQAGGHFDITDTDGNTPLHIAESLNIASWLLASGANPAAQNIRGETPLHQACSDSRLDLVTRLLQAGAPVDHRTKIGWTPLMFAHHIDISETLIRHGANVNAVADEGWTPLHYAAVSARPDDVSLLLSKGADVNAMLTYEQHFFDTPGSQSTAILVGSRTPLHTAVIAITYPESPAPASIVCELLDHGAKLEARDSMGRTPLLLAIATNGFHAPREDVVNCLIERGADMKAVDESGKDALQLADARNFRITDEKKFERKPPPPFGYGPRWVRGRNGMLVRGPGGHRC
jgi:ankyrin repeat protein